MIIIFISFIYYLFIIKFCLKILKNQMTFPENSPYCYESANSVLITIYMIYIKCRYNILSFLVKSKRTNSAHVVCHDKLGYMQTKLTYPP